MPVLAVMWACLHHSPLRQVPHRIYRIKHVFGVPASLSVIPEASGPIITGAIRVNGPIVQKYIDTCVFVSAAGSLRGYRHTALPADDKCSLCAYMIEILPFSFFSCLSFKKEFVRLKQWIFTRRVWSS